MNSARSAIGGSAEVTCRDRPRSYKALIAHRNGTDISSLKVVSAATIVVFHKKQYRRFASYGQAATSCDLPTNTFERDSKISVMTMRPLEILRKTTRTHVPPGPLCAPNAEMYRVTIKQGRASGDSDTIH
jgi:hypothetical protein